MERTFVEKTKTAQKLLLKFFLTVHFQGLWCVQDQKIDTTNSAMVANDIFLTISTAASSQDTWLES
jgi:hypothetical protein